MIRRSPVAYKERRRPTSIACLDSLHSYREKEALPRFFNDDHRLGSTDSTSRILNEGFKLPLRENTQRISRYSSNYSPVEEVESKFSSDIHRFPAKDRKILSESEKLSSKENTPRILTDTYRYHVKDGPTSTANTAAAREPDYHSLRRKSPVRDTKSRNFCDNYRHATSFPDSHLSRRELPLCSPDELLEIIREPTGYYALPTDPWNEVYPDVYLSDA